MRKDGADPATTARQRVCRCEATIAASVLEGFACGNPECWRTAEVRASFDAFVTQLVRRRGDEPPVPTAEP